MQVDYFYLKGYKFLKYIIGIFRLKKYIKKNNPDIIHAHYAYNGWTSSFIRNKPLICSFMGSDVIEEPDQSKIKQRTFNYLINKRVISKATAIICKTEEMEQLLKEKYKIRKKIKVIPNGVSLNIFFPMDKVICRKKLGFPLKKNFILFASNPNLKRKNYDLAFSALSLLENRNIELLTIYKVDQVTLNKYFNAADVLIFTSFVEGSPNVIKEAMATNLPIVSVNVGDVNKLLKNVKNSYVVNYNKKQIAEKIEQILHSGQRSNGREKIVKELDENLIAKKIISLYDYVLNLKINNQ
ncbi:MAG: glycosyltransferase family 4 protein [Candidatus Helarchaeota archaeon]